MASSSPLLVKGLVLIQVVMVVVFGSGVSAGKTLPLRSRVVVEGVVYCKSCAYKDVDTLLGATPLPGATVKLECNNTRVPKVVYATTDKNGYFYMEASKSKVTNYAVHKCKLGLSSSSLKNCSTPTNFNGGLTGAPLRFRLLIAGKPSTALYAAGPLAFAPTQCLQSPHPWSPPRRASSPFSPPPPHH